MDIKKLNELVKTIYKIYYDNPIEKFDELTAGDPDFKKVVSDLINYRKDFISSDREAAAVYTAIKLMEKYNF